MTNGNKIRAMTDDDKIRAMTDEELANRFYDEICFMHTGCPNIICIECALNWLKQEVNPNDEWRQDKSDDE